MSPRKIPDSVLTNALTTHDAIDRLVSGIEEIERDFNPGKLLSNQIKNRFTYTGLCRKMDSRLRELYS